MSEPSQVSATDAASLVAGARDALNRYFSVELGRSFSLPDPAAIDRQRQAFVARFGPEALAALSDSALLRELPPNGGDQTMDYWLEFKNDEIFEQSLFGSIAGGAATKFGTWQERQTGNWRAKRPDAPQIQTIIEAEALLILRQRRAEMLAAVAALRAFADQPLEQIAPVAMQTAVAAAAPQWHGSVVLHKYLHLVLPDLVTLYASPTWLATQVHRVGLLPDGAGLYARDLQIIRFWNSLPALDGLPPSVRYHAGRLLGPREHWALGLAGDAPAGQAMLADGCLALGPAEVGDLSPLIATGRFRDTRLAVETAFRDAGCDGDAQAVRDLAALTAGLTEGSLVMLFRDAFTVVAVGEVAGGYRYVPGTERPHRVSVNWLHHMPFATTAPAKLGTRLLRLAPEAPAVAHAEAALLVNGVGPWPGYQSIVDPPRSPPPDPTPVTSVQPLPPLADLHRQLLAVLARKRQVILYGPPGTGKTWHAGQVAWELVARHNFARGPSQLSESQRDLVQGRTGQPPYVATCTFHPGYAYEDFIEGYRPDGAGFRLEPGLFKRMAGAAAAQPDKRFVLIIDEINRGNIPRIFGELITLIEAGKRGTASVLLPLSKEPFTVPDNLFIIGTMNTADRSILLLDTALRRRFAFKELLPEPRLLRGAAIGDLPLSTWLRALNRRIVEQLGRDGRNLQIGHAYLMPGGTPATTLARIAEVVRDELWPLLQEYCYEDEDKLAAILAADRGGIFDRQRGDLRHQLFEPGQEDRLTDALMAILTPDDSTQEVALDADEEGDETDDPMEAEPPDSAS